MRTLPHAARYDDLIAYRKARELQQEIFRLTRGFPRDEVFALTSQLRRSTRSIGAQIAEAWGKRRYEAHFVSKLTDADSEQYETRHWISTALDCGYWDDSVAAELLRRCEELGRLLGGMIEKAPLFCNASPRSLREQTTEYFVPDSG